LTTEALFSSLFQPFPAGKGFFFCIKIWNYIDPPYNTGAAFSDFDDNLEHSKWLNLIQPRLVLLRELLADDGTIWISIGEDEQA